MVVVYNIDKVIDIGSIIWNETGILQGANVAVVLLVRVSSFEVVSFLVWCSGIHLQVIQCLSKLEKEVAEIGMVPCYLTVVAGPFEILGVGCTGASSILVIVLVAISMSTYPPPHKMVFYLRLGEKNVSKGVLH